MTTTTATKPQEAIAKPQLVQPPAAMQPRTIALSPNGALELRTLEDVHRVARLSVLSGMYPAIGRADPEAQIAQATMKILIGMELGLSPTTAIQGLIAIEGNLGFKAHVVTLLVDRHSKRVKARQLKWTREECVVEWHIDGERVGESSFSIEEAKLAGLAHKKNWTGYPKAMLWARALTQGARTFAPFIFNGHPGYTPEELGDDSEVVEFDDAGRPVRTVRVEEPVKRAPQGGNDKLRARAAAAKAAPVVEAEVTELAVESVVELEPGAGGPSVEETASQVDEPPKPAEKAVEPSEVLPPVEGAALPALLRVALEATPRDGVAASMTTFLASWKERMEKGELSKDDFEALRCWARSRYNLGCSPPRGELDGLSESARAVLMKLKAAMPSLVA